MTIRRVPRDFVVRELVHPDFLRALSRHPAKGFGHAVFEVTKTSVATPDVAAALCRSLRPVPKQSVADYAGLKDKHAVTTQLMSVASSGALSLDAKLAGPGWTASVIGWSQHPVTASAIQGNEFEIIVRDLSVAASVEMERRASLLSRLNESNSLQIVNYFGAQRFGSARHGKGLAGRELIRGDFLGALRLLVGTPARKDTGRTRSFSRLCVTHWGSWRLLASQLPRCAERRPFERLAAGASPKDAFSHLPMFLQQMAVEAYQSYLWNRIASNLIDALPGAFLTEDDFGLMHFAPASVYPSEFIDCNLPVLCAKSQPALPWADAASAVLSDEGVSIGDLRIPGLRRPFFGEAPRQLIVEARAFAMDAAQADEMANRKGRLKRGLVFRLPRGSYATVLLRALGQ